jgi:hypothetical protein
MRHEAEQFHLFERGDLFKRPELVPGTIVRLIWFNSGRKPTVSPHRYRVISPALAFLMTGDDPGTAADWQLRQFERDVALFPIDGPHIWHDMEHAGDFFPHSAVFWRGRGAVTAGY